MYIFLTQCFPSRLGGIESLISNLAIHIGKKEKVVVFADQNNILLDAIFDNKYKDIILVKRYSGIKYFRKRKKISEFKIFAESQFVKGIIADTWKSLELVIDYINLKKMPTFCLIHGNDLLSNNIRKKKRIVSTLNKTTSIIANSNYIANLYKEIIGYHNNIKVVYPGASDLRNIKVKNKINIEGSPIILTLARLDKRKGHEIVMKSIKKLKKDFPNIKYIIAGEGKEKNNLIKLVNDFGIKENIYFAGNVNDEQKKQLFEKTNLMVMPTLDERLNRSIEGFGISYIEAAFFGVSSIASNVGGTPEAVLDNDTGKVIYHHKELYETMYDLLSNKEKLHQLNKNAQNRAEKIFTWEKVADNYLLAFNSSIGR